MVFKKFFQHKNAPAAFAAGAVWKTEGIIWKGARAGGSLGVQLGGNMVADLGVQFLNTLHVFQPQLLIHIQQALDGVNGDAVQTGDVDILGAWLVADGRLNSLSLALAALQNPASARACCRRSPAK